MAMSLSRKHPHYPYTETGVKLGDEQFARDFNWDERKIYALIGMGVEPGMSDVFAAGEIVDATGTSKGKGTAGVMKRHGFSGIGASHGVDKKHRMSGSIGNRTTPGRVFKGKRMMGRMGIDTVTAQNLLVHSVDAASNKILVRGAVPGAIGATVFIKSAAKKAAGETINTKAGA